MLVDRATNPDKHTFQTVGAITDIIITGTAVPVLNKSLSDFFKIQNQIGIGTSTGSAIIPLIDITDNSNEQIKDKDDE